MVPGVVVVVEKYLPAEQPPVQDEDPAGLVEPPLGQDVQELAPTREKVDAGHVKQSLNEAPPTAEYVPATHAVHPPVVPAVVEVVEKYWPAEQAPGHVEDPAGLVKPPLGQDVQELVPPSEKVDAGHVMHELAVVDAYFPAPHSEHVAEPVTLLTNPLVESQTEQEVAPVKPEKEPTAHAKQSMNEAPPSVE